MRNFHAHCAPDGFPNHNAREGVGRLVTETGAGRWGSAPAFACAQYDLGCEVWMVHASHDLEARSPEPDAPLRRDGAREPLAVTASGAAVLAGDPGPPGSLGIAVGEAAGAAGADPGPRYALGSVLNHVLLHQTVVGEEAIEQMAAFGGASPGPIRERRSPTHSDTPLKSYLV